LSWTVIVSPEAATTVGYEVAPRYLIASYDEPPTQDKLDALLSAGSGGERLFWFRYEQGAPGAAPWLLLILGAAGVLILGAGSVALGLARVERRPDDVTLTAVGASPGVRRGIAFWQAFVIVGIGTVTGTVEGLIPAWGIVMSQNVYAAEHATMVDTPWPWLATLAVGLPLLIAVVSWLVPPRKGDLTRRTAIG
jgi:putative ABC transport system permease protein